MQPSEPTQPSDAPLFLPRAGFAVDVGDWYPAGEKDVVVKLPGSLLTPSSLCSASQLTSFYVALFFVLIQAATTDMDDGGDEDVSSCSSVASIKEEGFPGTCLCNLMHTARGGWNRRDEYKQWLAAVLPSLHSQRLVQALLLYILLLEPQLAQESGLDEQWQGM